MVSPKQIQIRSELPQDHAQVQELVAQAFGQPDEAALVERLRTVPETISMVAELNASIVGHIMFSRVQLIDQNAQQDAIKLTGLAPMAVSPTHQRRGIGKALIEAGIKHCQDAGYQACVLLGHPDYYPKFGFRPALSNYGIQSTYKVPDEAFMAIELIPNGLRNKQGTIHYHKAFEGL